MRKSKSSFIPLIVEPHPPSYEGYPFITLIKYNNAHYLTVVDNRDDKSIKAYVLDKCGPEGVSEKVFLLVAKKWYEESRNTPLSIYLTTKSVVDTFDPLYKTFNIDFVSRVIGPLPKFEMHPTQTVKRRRRKELPPGIVVEFKKT